MHGRHTVDPNRTRDNGWSSKHDMLWPGDSRTRSCTRCPPPAELEQSDKAGPITEEPLTYTARPARRRDACHHPPTFPPPRVLRWFEPDSDTPVLSNGPSTCTVLYVIWSLSGVGSLGFFCPSSESGWDGRWGQEHPAVLMSSAERGSCYSPLSHAPDQNGEQRRLVRARYTVVI